MSSSGKCHLDARPFDTGLVADTSRSPSTGPMSRSAWSGRNWEGFSPDPYLSGVAMGQSVLGIQDAGVQATAKHWILNEQEIMRHPKLNDEGRLQYESISSNADDRTIRTYHQHLKGISLEK